MTCCNCPEQAVFYLNDPGVNPLYYCRACLPPHFRTRAESGQLDLPKTKKTKTTQE